MYQRRRAADCGAVQHCIGTVWEQERVTVKDNDVSEKIVRLFRQLKDVKDMINDVRYLPFFYFID